MNKPATGDAPGDFMKSVAFLAPVGHIGWGALIMLTAAVFAHLSQHPWRAMAYVQLALTAVIGFKEGYIDPKYESDENLVSGFWDWLGWMGGAALAWGLAWLAHILGIWL